MFWPENIYIDAINDNVYGHLTLCYTLLSGFTWKFPRTGHEKEKKKKVIYFAKTRTRN